MESRDRHTIEASYKLVVLGETRVGKTSLALRFTKGQFQDTQQRTVNAQFLSKTLEIQGALIRANFWDTAGEEKYRALAPNYYRDAAGALVVYDITDKDSFRRVIAWVKELQNYGDPHCCIGVVGNKADKEREREVDREAAVKFAKEHNALHCETSAKTGAGVSEVFYALVRATHTVQSALQTQWRVAATGRARKKALKIQQSVDSSKPKAKCCYP